MDSSESNYESSYIKTDLLLIPIIKPSHGVILVAPETGLSFCSNFI
jgi:hypothetical protein